MAELAVELTAPIAGLMEARRGRLDHNRRGRFADRGGVLGVGFATALHRFPNGSVYNHYGRSQSP